jgi:hypothetical protein
MKAKVERQCHVQRDVVMYSDSLRDAPISSRHAVCALYEVAARQETARPAKTHIVEGDADAGLAVAAAAEVSAFLASHEGRAG